MATGSAILLALAAAATGAPTPPLFLTATEDGGTVSIKVAGRSASAFAGRYTLEAVAGSNRSVQSGTARLAAGQEATFIALNVGAAPGQWTATLRVEPMEGVPYTVALPTRP